MPSPDLVAASQSERTEAEARATMDMRAKLRTLAETAYAAKERYNRFSALNANDAGLTLDQRIDRDFEYQMALSLHVATENAYKDALREYAKQQAALPKPAERAEDDYNRHDFILGADGRFE